MGAPNVLASAVRRSTSSFAGSSPCAPNCSQLVAEALFEHLTVRKQVGVLEQEVRLAHSLVRPLRGPDGGVELPGGGEGAVDLAGLDQLECRLDDLVGEKVFLTEPEPVLVANGN